MSLRLCIAGATGAVGRALVAAVLAAPDLELAGATSRRAAGQDIGPVLGGAETGVVARASLAEALQTPTDVVIDYTAPEAVKANVLTAIGHGVPVVVGASGLSGADYAEIDKLAKDAGVGVVASGNFSLTAALLQHFALTAVRHLEQYEVIDYGRAGKPDAPSGTARELAEKLAQATPPKPEIPLAETLGEPAARGAAIDGVPVHSLRLPGFANAVEAIFGITGERLSLRHEAIEHGTPYVAGSLLAARKAPAITGLVRGLDTLMFG